MEMSIKIYISNTKRPVISTETLSIANDYDEMRTILRDNLSMIRNAEFSYSWSEDGHSDCCYDNAYGFENDAEDMIHKAIKFVKKYDSCNCVFFCDYENDKHKTISIFKDEVDTHVK